jgi:hypothetical protein
MVSARLPSVLSYFPAFQINLARFTDYKYGSTHTHICLVFTLLNVNNLIIKLSNY